MARKRPQAYTEVHDDDTRTFVFPSYALQNTRDLRSLMLDAAYALQEHPDAIRAQIALQVCTLSKSTVQREVDQFLATCRPSLARRLQVLDLRLGTNTSTQAMVSNDAQRALAACKPNKASQEAVIATLLQRHIRLQPGLTIDELVTESGASIPTVYQAIRRYEHCIAPRSQEDKAIRIKTFPRTAWKEWIERSNRLSSVYFIDRSGAPRSATRLAKTLARLQRDDLAIGGLMGAMHHLPALDATAAPHLDILIHGTPRSDLSFIEQIDPGLKMSKDLREPAHVVVHFVDRPQSLFVRESEHNWGSLPDCIANMWRARLTHQVDDAIARIDGLR